MKIRRHVLHSWVTLPLAATVALSACAPQATQQANRTADLPAAVEQAQAAKVLPAGTFTGMIATFDGHDFVPVAGAAVAVEGTGQMAVTDADGHYAIHGLKAGTYKVVATKDGFVQGGTEVVLSPVAGTPRVNMAMNKNTYGLKQIAAFTATVSGVVKDPRGAALPSATVRVVSNAGTGTNQTVTANPNGFYSSPLANASVNVLSPGWVQVTAFGTTPGGVKVETSAAVANTLTSAAVVMDPKCDAYTQPKNITFPAGTFAPMGSTGTIKVEYMTTRADEFYIELNSGGQKYAVLADTIVNTPAGANNTPPQSCTITFRIPFTMPANTFTTTLRPFGSTAGVLAGSSFVVQYDTASLEADVAYKALSETFTDETRGTNEAVPGTAPPSINGNATISNFVAGEDAKYTITLTNNSTDISQDIRLEGRAPVGATIKSAKITTTQNAVAGTPVTLAAANITQPNGSGDWAITGFSIPSKVGGNLGECAVEVIFGTPATLAKGTSMALSNLATKMPSANLTKTTAPSTPAGLTVRNIEPTTFELVSKVITEVGGGAVNGDGVGLVTLVVRPTGATALGAIKITDTTGSDQAVPASSATITGTKALATSPTPLGLLTSDKFAVSVDGAAETVISVSSTGWDLETLCGFISGIVNASGTVITCQRDGSNRFFIQRTAQGTAKTLNITATTTGNMQNVLGITTGSVAGTNGLTAEFAGAGVVAQQDQGNDGTPTTWSFTNTSSTHNAGGTITSNFTVVPPALFAEVADTYTSDVTISYRIVKTGGGAVQLGGGAGATARLLAVNLLAPFTTTANDQTLAVNATTTKADPAAVAGL